MRKLIFLLFIGCGISSPLPQPDIYIVETSPAPLQDTFQPEYIPEDPCRKKIIEISRESEKCFSDIRSFWDYMREIEKISCEDLLLNNYPRAC